MVGANGGIVVLVWVVHVVLVGLSIWVSVHRVVGIKREEKSVPGSVLLVICPSLISVRLIL